MAKIRICLLSVITVGFYVLEFYNHEYRNLELISSQLTFQYRKAVRDLEIILL